MRVAIIGAGLSGLACAHHLETKGFNGKIDIFEERSTIGTGITFAEYVPELFYRPIPDFFRYLQEAFTLSLYPLTTVYQSTYYGPTKRSYLRDQFTGHLVVRGDHPESLEKQLAAQVRTPIQYDRSVNIQEIASAYDFVVLASGQLADVPPEVGVRVDRTVQILHGIINGTFESDHLRFWWNDTLAPKGYGYMLPISDTQAMIAITSPIDRIELRNYWPHFVDQVRKDVGFVTNPIHQESFHLVKGLSIGQPNAYMYNNILLVGNAAGVITPSFGFGLHMAILSGIYAAQSIVTQTDYPSLMEHHTREYRWSLALRNQLEAIGSDGYDQLVDGIDSFIWQMVVRQGGYNATRFLGKILAAFTNETEASRYPSNPHELPRFQQFQVESDTS